jgi:predicted dehydrogenase
VYTVRKERARKTVGLDAKDVHHDYHDLLARNDVDAVVIATPDHWHARMALDAMAAGKDVYLQKPMTYTIDEAKQVAATAKKLGRVLQVGSQGLSSPAYHKAKELIDAGELGELLWAQGTSSRNSKLGEWNWTVEKEGTPETIDWKRWLGPAPKRPFSPERYFRWRKYWDYSGGIATDLFYHTLGPLVFSMGLDFPFAVSASGGIFVQKDREVPDTYATLIEYPKCCINLSGSMANAAGVRHHGYAIYGNKGTMTFERGRVIVTPENPGAGSFDKRSEVTPKVYEVQEHANTHDPHFTNFFECMRTRKQPNLNGDLGYRIMTAIRLGTDAYREGRTRIFDKAPTRPTWEGDGQNHTVS